jgi:hypothetical protein
MYSFAMTRNFPEIFAILRDGVREPCLQILRSFPCEYHRGLRRNTSYRGYYEISNVENPEEFDGRLLPASSFLSHERTIHTLHTFHPETAEPLDVYYWMTPYVLQGNRGRVIPLLEFQYRSWIPVGYHPLPVRANLNEVYAILSQIQQERLDEIRRREDNEAFQNPPRHYSDPYFQPRRHNEDLQDTWWRMTERGAGNHRRSRPQTPPPPSPRIIESVRLVEVPVDRVVVQHRILPLPKDVGNLLLSNARKSADSCPIAATPFSECESLCVSSCFHIFDASSLARWQETHTSCPVCRCKIENVVVEEGQNGVPTV